MRKLNWSLRLEAQWVRSRPSSLDTKSQFNSRIRTDVSLECAGNSHCMSQGFSSSVTTALP